MKRSVLWKSAALVAGIAILLILTVVISRRVELNAEGPEALTFAVRSQYLPDVARLLKLGADPNVMVGRYEPLIHVASENYDPDIFELLLRKGADANAVDRAGVPVLLRVVQRRTGNGPQAVEFLLEAGADPNVLDPQGWSPLALAALANNRGYDNNPYPEIISLLREYGAETGIVEALFLREFDKVQSMVERDPGLLTQRFVDDTTLIILAAATAPLPLLEFILDQGVNVNAEDASGRTGLHDAVGSEFRRRIIGTIAWNGYGVDRVHTFERVRMLLEHGADPNIEEAGNFSVPVHYAASQGAVDLLQLFADHHADLNALDKYEMSPLAYALQNGHMDAAKLLLKLGADVAPDYVGEWSSRWSAQNRYVFQHIWPIEIAVARADLEAFEMLVEHGATISVQRRHTSYLLGVLADRFQRPEITLTDEDRKRMEKRWRDAIKIFDRLIEMGALSDPTRNATSRALVEFSNSETCDPIRKMVGLGVNINGQDGEGRNILNKAILDENFDLIPCLLELGADPSWSFGNGTTFRTLGFGVGEVGASSFFRYPIHAMIQHERADLVLALLKHGADPNVLDSQGRTARDIAREMEYAEVLEILESYQVKKDVESARPPQDDEE